MNEMEVLHLLAKNILGRADQEAKKVIAELGPDEQSDYKAAQLSDITKRKVNEIIYKLLKNVGEG